MGAKARVDRCISAGMPHDMGEYWTSSATCMLMKALTILMLVVLLISCSRWKERPSEPPKQRLQPQQSLNDCPFNLEAERLAVEECELGKSVRREWSEMQMVHNFGGHMVPGTPDGMFEYWTQDGEANLQCVQVVRGPIVFGMGDDEISDVLHQTVLTKASKSISWMIATKTLPHDFTIFCWLQFQPPEECVCQADELVDKIRSELGWPF